MEEENGRPTTDNRQPTTDSDGQEEQEKQEEQGASMVKLGREVQGTERGWVGCAKGAQFQQGRCQPPQLR